MITDMILPLSVCFLIFGTVGFTPYSVTDVFCPQFSVFIRQRQGAGQVKQYVLYTYRN